MAEPRTVVITGASRGLELLIGRSICISQGWRVVAGHAVGRRRHGQVVREADRRRCRRRSAIDRRSRASQTDAASVTAAAKSIEEAVGTAVLGLVHNAGYGCTAAMIEETADRASWVCRHSPPGSSAQ